MKILTVKDTSHAQIIDVVVQTLSKGGLIIFPTETTYGAGVDATNQTAVDKLLAYKSRREGKPLSIAVVDREMAEQYVEINESAERIYQTFLPGPFTVVSKSRGQTAAGVDSEFGTLGVRIPDYPLVLDMIKAFGQPLTATSANSSGKKRPYKIADLLASLSQKQKNLIDLIIDAGKLPRRRPSTIIDTTLSTPLTLRQGEQLADGAVDVSEHGVEFISDSESETRALAQRLLLKNWEKIKHTGLVMGLTGDLGVGKTIFTKGVAEFLQIDQVIKSPTYNYVYEYDFNRHGVTGKLVHFDAWKIDSAAALERLDFAAAIQPHQVVVVEWWSQVEPLVSGDLGAPLLKIEISENVLGQRVIKVQEL